MAWKVGHPKWTTLSLRVRCCASRSAGERKPAGSLPRRTPSRKGLCLAPRPHTLNPQRLKERLVVYYHSTSASAAHATHCATYCIPSRPHIRAFSQWIRTPRESLTQGPDPHRTPKSESRQKTPSSTRGSTQGYHKPYNLNFKRSTLNPKS